MTIGGLVMSFVAVDVGASCTRYATEKGKIGILPNNVVFLELEDEVDLQTYSKDIDDSLEVIIESNNKNEIFPIRALMGDMANRYSGINVRPSVMLNKHAQRINYLSAIVAAALSIYKDSIDNRIDLHWALPPVEVRTAKDILRNNCIGKYAVTFPKYGNLKIEFEVAEVEVYEESSMAMLSYFFDGEGKAREESTKYNEGNILSLDIGASSTDLAVVNNMKYLEKSGQTYKTGGNIAREFLIDDIRAMYGFDLPADIADDVIAEGRLQLGNGYEDVSNIVEAAKQHLAEQVVEQIQGYFRKIGIPIQSIRAIVASGGGSMQGQYVNEDNEVVITSKPMSYYITKALVQVCQGVEVENYKYNPRLAVIRGLYLRAMMIENGKRVANN